MLVTKRNWLRHRHCILIAGSLAGMVVPALAGDLKGRIIAEGMQAPESSILSRSIIQRYAAHQHHDAGDGMKKHDDFVAVVYIEGLENSSRGVTSPVAVMDQQHERFLPHVLPITVGSTVRFLNSEEVFHNVFSLSPVKSFDLGRYPKGQHREVVFDKTGVVSVYCDIHTQMNAVILVVPNRFFTITDAAGNFVIKDIPPGDHEVRVWYGRQPEKSTTVIIKEQGTTELILSIP